jgi:hypothetical protein
MASHRACLHLAAQEKHKKEEERICGMLTCNYAPRRSAVGHRSVTTGAGGRTAAAAAAPWWWWREMGVVGWRAAAEDEARGQNRPSPR